MSKAAIVVDGVVVNIIKIKTEDGLPDNWYVVNGGVGIGYLDNGDGTFSAPPKPTPDPKLPYELREAELSKLTYDFGDGRKIYVRCSKSISDESNIRNTIERMVRLAITEQNWEDEDGNVIAVTPEDLQIALESMQDQSAAIWQEYYEALIND